MARLHKQRQQQMNVDNKFAGYRAAEVAANKARMEAAKQEFSVEEHLRQLEQQEQRRSSKGVADDDDSDHEAESVLDPAVRMFQLPCDFQNGRVVCDAVDGPDAVLAELLNSASEDVRTTLQSNLLLAYSLKVQRPLPEQVADCLWRGAVRGNDHTMATECARNLAQCIAARACAWTLSYDHIVEALLTLRFTPFLWEGLASTAATDAIELSTCPTTLMTPTNILHMRLQCMLQILQTCLANGTLEWSQEDLQSLFVALVQVAADSGAQTHCGIWLSECIHRVQAAIIEHADSEFIAQQIVAGLQEANDENLFGLAAVYSTSTITDPRLCTTACFAAIAVIMREQEHQSQEDDNVVSALIRKLTQATQQEIKQESLLSTVYSLIALTDRILCLTPGAWKHEEIMQLEVLLKRLIVRIRRSPPSVRKLRAEDLVTKFPERCRMF